MLSDRIIVISAHCCDLELLAAHFLWAWSLPCHAFSVARTSAVLVLVRSWVLALDAGLDTGCGLYAATAWPRGVINTSVLQSVRLSLQPASGLGHTRAILSYPPTVRAARFQLAPVLLQSCANQGGLVRHLYIHCAAAAADSLPQHTYTLGCLHL